MAVVMQERLDGAICPGWLPQSVHSWFLKRSTRRRIHHRRLPICQHRRLELRGRGLGEVAVALSAEPQRQPPTDSRLTLDPNSPVSSSLALIM